jgi:hypothetical protein
MSADPLLDRARAYTDEQIVARLRRHLGNAVDAIGPGIAAGAVDASRSDLRQALNADPGRYVRLDWIVPLLRLASTDDRAAFLGELLGAFGLESVPVTRRSAERRLLDLEAAVAEELGSAGRRVVDAERGRP